MITKEQFLEALEIVNNYRIQLEKHYKEVNDVSKFFYTKPTDLIIDVGLSVRLLNILYPLYCSSRGFSREDFHKVKVSDLGHTSISELNNLKNFGKNTLLEIKELCYYAGVNLKP